MYPTACAKVGQAGQARAPFWRPSCCLVVLATVLLFWFAVLIGASFLVGMMSHRLQARLALYPEYHNVPMASDPRPDARHGVHPRGALAPIQRALGVWADPRQDTVVYVKRRGARSLRCDIEEAIIEGIRARLARTGVALEVS